MMRWLWSVLLTLLTLIGVLSAQTTRTVTITLSTDEVAALQWHLDERARDPLATPTAGSETVDSTVKALVRAELGQIVTGWRAATRADVIADVTDGLTDAETAELRKAIDALKKKRKE